MDHGEQVDKAHHVRLGWFGPSTLGLRGGWITASPIRWPGYVVLLAFIGLCLLATQITPSHPIVGLVTLIVNLIAYALIVRATYRPGDPTR